MTRSSTWILLAVSNLVAWSGAAYLVGISGKLAGVMPGLFFLLILDLRACQRLLQQPDGESDSGGGLGERGA